ncbi:TRNA binding domain containing protein [Tritrichomonas foetus]|uniref:tRNA binding domain containing protein n=1 Tax=Tritrichomonas foetus TaxID=1144522 RepID=A0A1J4JLG3_9EUKA|nr:TRNA binding domain containing protein [Tritrichomonas foetus]|eukprot:OHS98389.1 TRNA binding domain containing protein [Tritrichomonas foetus]
MSAETPEASPEAGSEQQTPIVKPTNGEKPEKVILHPRQKKIKPPKKEKAPAPPPKDPICAIDCRVGQIVKVGVVPDADTLYVEEVDVGNGVTKHIVTSVRKYYTEEQLLNRRVCVFVNIHPGKMRGETSEAMLLGASTPDPDLCELLDPPEGDPVGTRIFFGHFNENEPQPETNDNKNKQWKRILPHHWINKEGVAVYKNEPIHTASGPLTVPTLRDCEFH